MSAFIVDEADEHEEDQEEYDSVERKKLKRLHIEADSSEEEEEDEEQLKKISENFIDDNEEEEEDAGSDSDVGGKRKRNSDDSEDLSDDDFDLIEENTGVKIKKKFKRVRRLVDDESDAEDDDDRTQTSHDVQGSDDEEMADGSGGSQQKQGEVYSDGGDDSDGSFIVDDDGQPIQRQKKRPIFGDAGLETARDIFGCDFDYKEFEQYDDYEEREEGDDDEDLDYEDEDEEEMAIRKQAKEKRKHAKKSIFEIFEPSELERGHLTDRDHEIRKEDVPERFQTRQIPVTPTRPEGDDRTCDAELEEEAKWIYTYAFHQPCISNQEGRQDARSRPKRDSQMIQKIYNALDLIRNSTCEVPFIAFFRKEEVQPELNIHDLWKIFNWDEKWCQLLNRKNNLINRYQKMGEYQLYAVISGGYRDQPLTDNFRIIKAEEIDRIRTIQTTEQFNDYYKHYLLYYGDHQEKMKDHFRSMRKGKTKIIKRIVKKIVMRKKHKKKANIGADDDDIDEGVDSGDDKDSHDEDEEEVETEVETEVEEEVDVEDEVEQDGDKLKKAIRRHEYEFLKGANLGNIVKKFGLTPEQFGDNLRDSYQRCEINQCQEDPTKEAENYISKICATPERVLEAAVRMVGWEIACEPLVRNTIRDVYFERARINVRATPKGQKIIDEQHNLYPLKYLSDKPVTDLQGEQFLILKCGMEENLITLNFSDNIEGSSIASFLDEMKQLYYIDEFSQVVQDWNDLRSRAVEFAYAKVISELKRELSQRLLNESKGHVIEMCCRKLYNWLRVAPYNPGDFSDEDEDDWDTIRGFRVFSVAYTTDLVEASFGCCIDIDGDCCEYIRLPHLLKRKNSYNSNDVMAKESDLTKLKEFIIRRKPHVIVVGADSREALMVAADLKDIVRDLEEQEQFPKINVELVENDLAKVYAMSRKAEQDFYDYPSLLRQAISLGRRIQDPLAEFSQLCNTDDEILNLSYHTSQNQLSPQELYSAIATEFVNRTNEVGVDLNRAVAHSYTQNLVQFVCGLGARKAHALIKSMKQSNVRLENRNQLVVSYHMGPKVFINCAGFIKIDTTSLGDSDNYIEVLDSTRIHPEAYDWARKMAVDALEYEDEEGKPAEALEEILEAPERLSELDLEAFATELHNQGFGKKSITLYDIRHELNHRYKDFRQEYRSPSPEEIFNMLTKESPETFFIGKLIQATVIDFIHRKPKGEQLDSANPLRNDETGLWQCPFCMKPDFPELSEVWNHFDAEDCPGQAVGIRVRLDNGISGFINIKNLSDSTVNNPADRVKQFRLVHCRIMKIDPEKFSVELTCRSSDLQDKENKWKPSKDRYYDMDAEQKDLNKEKQKLNKKRSHYQKRVISHPSFKNIDYAEAEKLMQNMDQGDAIIRPSSKGSDHLTVTWKVSNGICQHIDIREQNKQNDFSLGQKLWIGGEEFEDLDEILARHISPMASNARQILEYKYYKEWVMGSKEKATEILREEKKNNVRTIPYIFSTAKLLPGKFLLSYLPRVKVIHEYVTVLPDGLRFRSKLNFTSLASLLKWFKSNFRNMIRNVGGATTPMIANRTPYLSGTTPMVDSSTLQKVAHNMPSHMLQNLTSAATGTPFSTISNYANTPYTPSSQTPFMTPYGNTPGPSNTNHNYRS